MPRGDLASLPARRRRGVVVQVDTAVTSNILRQSLGEEMNSCYVVVAALKRAITRLSILAGLPWTRIVMNVIELNVNRYLAVGGVDTVRANSNAGRQCQGRQRSCPGTRLVRELPNFKEDVV